MPSKKLTWPGGKITNHFFFEIQSSSKGWVFDWFQRRTSAPFDSFKAVESQDLGRPKANSIRLESKEGSSSGIFPKNDLIFRWKAGELFRRSLILICFFSPQLFDIQLVNFQMITSFFFSLPRLLNPDCHVLAF